MVFRRLLATAAAQALVFLAGAGAWAAWSRGLFGAAASSTLLGLWTMLALVLQARSALQRRVEPSAPAPPRLRPELDARALRNLLDQTPAALVTFDSGGVVHALNRAARALFRTDDRVVGPAPALLSALGEAEPGERRQVQLGQDEAERTYAFTAADVWTHHGAVRLAALTDVQPEMQAAQAQALQATLQVLSHEVMNSLTPVASLAETAGELLADDTPEGRAAAREALAVVARRTAGLNRFVQSYRALARLPAPTLRPTSVTALLEDVGRLFRIRWQGGSVELALKPPSPDIHALMDPDLTSQALLALLNNGAEAALSAGRDPSKVTLQATAWCGGLEIAIEDNGPGVPATNQQAIFEPFVTTKPEGSGVGLTLARQIIAAQGGVLVLSPGSTPERGARFCVRM